MSKKNVKLDGRTKDWQTWPSKCHDTLTKETNVQVVGWIYKLVTHGVPFLSRHQPLSSIPGLQMDASRMNFLGVVS